MRAAYPRVFAPQLWPAAAEDDAARHWFLLPEILDVHLNAHHCFQARRHG